MRMRLHELLVYLQKLNKYDRNVVYFSSFNISDTDFENNSERTVSLLTPASLYIIVFQPLKIWIDLLFLHKSVAASSSKPAVLCITHPLN